MARFKKAKQKERKSGLLEVWLGRFFVTLFAAIGLIFTPILFYGAWSQHREAIEFQRDSIPTEAIILERYGRCNQKSSHFYIRYEYNVLLLDGVKKSFVTDEVIRRCDLYSVFNTGQRIDIQYLRDNPSESHVVENPFNNVGLFLGGTVSLLCFSVPTLGGILFKIKKYGFYRAKAVNSI